MKSMSSPLRRVYHVCAASVLMASLVFFAGSASAQQTGKGVLKLRMSFFPPPGSARGASDPQLLVHYLEKETGATIELTAVKNTEEALERMANNEVDVANLGGLEFVQASARVGAKPRVQREEDQKPQAAFITQPNSNIRSLSDLNGHTFSFATVTSVSSHVMPEYYLREAKVDPAVMQKAIYNERDAQVMAVANNKVDAAVVNPNRLQAMIKDGRITADQVRVFWTSPPFVDTVWVSRPDLDPKLAESLDNAFLKLEAKNPEHKPILDLLQATKYVRATDSSYDRLRQGAKAAGLLK